MPAVSPAQLALMRKQVTASLPDVCDILQGGETEDDIGGEGGADTVLAANVPCEVKPLQPVDELQKGARMTAVGLYIISLPWNSVVRPENTLRVNGVIYEIQEVPDNLSNIVSLNVRCRRVW